jgi:hypothetical protein
MHHLVYRFLRRLYDVDEPFVCHNFKILAAVPVYKCRSSHIKMFPICRQWDRSNDFGTGPDRNIKNFLTAIVNDPAVV